MVTLLGQRCVNKLLKFLAIGSSTPWRRADWRTEFELVSPNAVRKLLTHERELKTPPMQRNKLYLNGLRDARSGQDILYFEFPLEP